MLNIKNILGDRRFMILIHDCCAVAVAVYLAAWISLDDIKLMLINGYVTKQVLTFTVLASGFFLLFRSYRGVWRFLCLRQTLNVFGLMGLVSLIYFPIATKAHLQPVEIPGFFVGLCWLLSSVILVGSRLFIRTINEKLLAEYDDDLDSEPCSRLIIIGQGAELEKSINNLNHEFPHRYEILGIVRNQTQERINSLKGVPMLGTLADLHELIENFNAQGRHPHHIVVADPCYFGEPVRKLVNELATFKVDFKTLHPDGSLNNLTISNLYSSALEENLPKISPLELSNDSHLLVIGINSTVGQDVINSLDQSKFSGRLSTADFPSTVNHTDGLESYTHISPAHYTLLDSSIEGLRALYSQTNATHIINLTSLARLSASLNPRQESIQNYLELALTFNKSLIEAASNTSVKNIYVASMDQMLSGRMEEIRSLSDYALTSGWTCMLNTNHTTSYPQVKILNLPFILPKTFDRPYPNLVRTTNKQIDVCTCTGAAILIIEQVSNNLKFQDDNVLLDTHRLVTQVSLTELLKHLHQLDGNMDILTNIIVESSRRHTLKDQPHLLEEIIQSLKIKDYSKVYDLLNGRCFQKSEQPFSSE